MVKDVFASEGNCDPNIQYGNFVGYWVQEYTEKNGNCDTVHAKIWGMYANMELTQKR